MQKLTLQFYISSEKLAHTSLKKDVTTIVKTRLAVVGNDWGNCGRESSYDNEDFNHADGKL